LSLLRARCVVWPIVLAMGLVVCRVGGAVIVEGIAAVVNGQPIFVSEVNEALAPYRAEFAKTYRGAELEDKVRQAVQTLLSQMIDRRLLLQEADRLGLSVSATTLDTAFEKIRSRFASEEEFRRALAEYGDTEADVRDEIVRAQLVQQVMLKKRRQFEEQVVVSEQDVRERMDKSEAGEALKKQVELWQIWISAPRDASGKMRAEARSRCVGILDRLRGGADFEQVAREVSEGPERDRGGLMGMVRQGEMQTELDAAAFSMAAGEMSGIVESDTGFHILRVTRVEEPDPARVDEARRAAEAEVRVEKVKEMYERWLDELREKADIVR